MDMEKEQNIEVEQTFIRKPKIVFGPDFLEIQENGFWTSLSTLLFNGGL